MYSAYKLNKQGDNVQPWRTPFPMWNQSVVPCPVLSVASWPAYRFLKRQVRWSGIPISFSRGSSRPRDRTLVSCISGKHFNLWATREVPTCLLRNLYTGQEATVRTGHGTTDWFQIGKEVHQGCILSPCLFSLYAEYVMRNTGLEEAQAGIKLPGEISITSDMQMTPSLWQKMKRN